MQLYYHTCGTTACRSRVEYTRYTFEARAQPATSSKFEQIQESTVCAAVCIIPSTDPTQLRTLYGNINKSTLPVVTSVNQDVPRWYSLVREPEAINFCCQPYN